MTTPWTGQAVLITGGAGFVGSNLAHALLADGVRVRVLDDLSRAGVERNLAWLRDEHGDDALDVRVGDVTDEATVGAAVRGVGAVFHLAAQVAVTSSIDDPQHDFATNVIGTMNLLETIRALPSPVPIVFTSTNKVYGELEAVDLVAGATRYEPLLNGAPFHGVDETTPLDFRSPYGCSKGAADQYVLDYARTFDLPAVVFRMSCIYGPHQFGTEDQGWVAHFLIRALSGRPITIYGDGKQVRDVLFVDDLVAAFRLAADHADRIAGQAFNIGGGPHRTTSLLELIAHIADLEGRAPKVNFAPWRLGDQRHYVSDPRRFMRAVGWAPSVGVAEGVRRLHAWLRAEGGVPTVAERFLAPGG
jgi:CDP-paratose 2-epimerase